MANHGGDGHPERDPEVARLARLVRQLSERVAALESRLGEAPPGEAAGTGTDAPLARESPAADPIVAKPAAGRKAPGTRTPESAMRRSHPGPPQPERPAWQVGPLRDVRPENLPVVVMAAAGGLALLMGALYFAWYSIRRGWIPPEVRITTTAVLGLLALVGAWRLARRGQSSVASGVGGAGLGAWFGAVLVARHAHDFVGPGQTFGLLVFGAACGILVAAHGRLRFLATLASLGALFTPLFLGSAADRLHERMVYQLVVVAFLYWIERRRRWPELGFFAVCSSWILLNAWLDDHAGGPSVPWSVVWAFVYLIVGHLLALNLVQEHRGRRTGAPVLLWINAYAAWALAARAAEDPDVVALGMALVNGVTGITLLRTTERNWGRSCVSACLSAAWMQAFAFAPLRWAWVDVEVLVWWSAMALLAAVLHVWRGGTALGLPFALPFLAGLLWSAEHTGTSGAAPLGFTLAALPLVIALWPPSKALERGRLDTYLVLFLVAGGLAWAAMAHRHLAEWTPPEGWFLAACVAAIVPVTLRVLGQPSLARCFWLLAALIVLVLTSSWLSSENALFSPHLGFAEGHAWQAGGLLAVGGLALLVELRFRQRMRDEPEVEWFAPVHDVAGVITPGAILVVAMLLFAAWMPSITADSANASSLNQACWSVCMAVAGLVLLLRGLFARRSLWRGVGMALLFATAAKLVAVDLLRVSMLWRVLSFAGLGACLLLGAYFYRRLGAWVEREGRA